MGPATLAIVALIAVVSGVRFLMPGALVSLGSPFWTAGTALTAGVGSAGSFFTDKTALMAERDRLLAENAAFYAKSATAEARARDLERLLGDREEAGEGILAGVLARPPVSPYDMLILDRGSDDGVSVGARVLGDGGMPLGRIESVTPSSARALLLSTPANETESWIGDARIPVTLVGEGAGSMSAIIAREAGIIVGDLVYAMGPGAIAAGTVISVENDPSSPRSRVDIRPLSNPFSVTWVTIVP